MKNQNGLHSHVVHTASILSWLFLSYLYRTLPIARYHLPNLRTYILFIGPYATGKNIIKNENRRFFAGNRTTFLWSVPYNNNMKVTELLYYHASATFRRIIIIRLMRRIVVFDVFKTRTSTLTSKCIAVTSFRATAQNVLFMFIFTVTEYNFAHLAKRVL